MCFLNGIFSPTFPLEKMTLFDMVYAALAPSKWLAFSSKPTPPNDEGNELSSSPSHWIYLEEDGLSGHWMKEGDDDKMIADVFVERTLFLVPGGRFLIVTSPIGTMIWDFGLSAYRRHTPEFKPEVVAAADSPLDTLDEFFPTPDGLGVYMVKCRKDDINGQEIQ